jgi:peptidoglycan/xylan/chitin deacetylase (PgdA/CDA1 family)
MQIVPKGKAALTRARAISWRLRRRNLQGGLRIFLYHRVSDDADVLALSPAKFRAQMEHLAAEGYRGLDAVTALDLLYAGELEPHHVAITFDDGFKDVEENALPVLDELGFSASVFVATEVIDGSARYLWAPEDAQLLDWDEIRRLDAAGVLRFEPHTLTHPNLTTLGDRECRQEIEGSKIALEQQLGRETFALCFPGGFVGKRERDDTQESGLRYGITCEPGLNTPETDAFLIRRVQIDQTDSLGDFAAKVRGSHDRGLIGRGLYRRLRYGSVA